MAAQYGGHVANLSANQPQVRCLVFGDIAGSTERAVAEARDGVAADHNAAICRCMDLWRELLHPFGLEFFKPMGDGFLASMLDPLSAVRGVLHTRAVWDRDPACLRHPLRIGIHVGTVFVGPDLDPGGVDVNLAQRVMNKAQGNEILLSSACAAMVSSYLQGVTTEDLGLHPVKGFDTPVRLFLLRSPGLVSPQRVAGVSTHGNLPISLDRFIGRKREQSLLRRYVLDTLQRGVTLAGPAGCGKTRLAAEVAREVKSEFSDGAVFVSLEGAATEDAAVSRVAAALSVPLNVQTNPHEAVRSALSHLRTLLVLDGFEQTPDAATLVSRLLTSLPELHILATSHAPLRYRGERILDIVALDAPAEGASFGEVRACESVKLFVERARAADARFRLTPANSAPVAALCRAVGGLPLALELLATEVRNRPVSRIVEMGSGLLDVGAEMLDAPERQRSLRAALEWVFSTLTERQRQLLLQLSIFESPFGDEAYEVCTIANIEQELRHLRERGVLYHPACYMDRCESRPYQVLLPARQFARERLGKPSGALRKRFVAAFTRKAENLYDMWRRHAEAAALDGVRVDLENFRAAWGMVCEDGDPRAIVDLGLPVTFFTPSLPRSAEIEPWLDTLDSTVQRLNEPRQRGTLFNTRARLASRRGAYEEAVHYQQAALHLIEQADSAYELADAYATLAFFALRAGQSDMAERHAALAVGAAQQAGALEPEAVATFVMARLLLTVDPVRAEELARSSVRLFETEGVYRGMAHACLTLAEIAENRRDLDCAEECYRDALSLCLGEGEEVQVVRCAEALAAFYDRCGKPGQAKDLYEGATISRQALGMPTVHPVHPVHRRGRPVDKPGDDTSREPREVREPLSLRSVATRVLSLTVESV